jgi:hypothetical protein
MRLEIILRFSSSNVPCSLHYSVQRIRGCSEFTKFCFEVELVIFVQFLALNTKETWLLGIHQIRWARYFCSVFSSWRKKVVVPSLPLHSGKVSWIVSGPGPWNFWFLRSRVHRLKLEQHYYLFRPWKIGITLSTVPESKLLSLPVPWRTKALTSVNSELWCELLSFVAASLICC